MSFPTPLSPRESAVVELLLQGKSNKQIAAALGIADSTVEFHLTNIYAKLQVGSRTETILKLGKSIGSNPTDEPGKSSVVEMLQAAENDGKPISPRRFPMKNILIVSTLALLTIALLVAFLFSSQPARPVATATTTLIPFDATPMTTPQPSISAKGPILKQIHQLVDEYEQSIQSEKKNGKVKFEKDPLTGKDIFWFQDESYETVSNLSQTLNEKVNQLNRLYAQIYRDELRPTPFPTQASAEQNKDYYDHLDIAAQCTYMAHPGETALEISIYRPEEGKYIKSTFGDPDARCTVFGQMMEEFRVAPMLAKVNQDADMATIRQIVSKPDLKLTFQSVNTIANAPWQNAAIYQDETGTNYYVDADTARLAQIEPNFSSHPQIAENETKTLDELRKIATQFALTNSPRLAALKSVLAYEEGGKGNIHFFDWRYNSKDWSGTDWAMMPPMLQVGVLSNGEIVTYINTLDLFK